MIGERLKDLRLESGLTQKQLAKKLHLTSDNISAYERDYNEAPDDVKIALAQLFGVSTDYLLGLTDEPKPGCEPKNYIILDRDFPPEIKIILQTLVRMLSVYSCQNPAAVNKKLDRMLNALLKESGKSDEEPDNDSSS